MVARMSVYGIHGSDGENRSDHFDAENLVYAMFRVSQCLNSQIWRGTLSISNPTEL